MLHTDKDTREAARRGAGACLLTVLAAGGSCIERPATNLCESTCSVTAMESALHTRSRPHTLTRKHDTHTTTTPQSLRRASCAWPWTGPAPGRPPTRRSRRSRPTPLAAASRAARMATASGWTSPPPTGRAAATRASCWRRRWWRTQTGRTPARHSGCRCGARRRRRMGGGRMHGQLGARQFAASVLHQRLTTETSSLTGHTTVSSPPPSAP